MPLAKPFLARPAYELGADDRRIPSSSQFDRMVFRLEREPTIRLAAAERTVGMNATDAGAEQKQR